VSSIDYRVSKELVTSPANLGFRYVEALYEFYRLADQVDIRSASFVEMNDTQIAITLEQMIAELKTAKGVTSFALRDYWVPFNEWSKRLLANLSYERNGLEQHEVKVALKRLAHKAAQLSGVIETEVGRNNYVRELESVEELTRRVYGEPEFTQKRAINIRDYIVGLIEDCADILEEAGSSVDELTPLRDDFEKAFEQEYGMTPVTVG